jgi:hypothetical protein
MGILSKTKCIILVESVHFNGVKFAVLGFEGAGLFVPLLEVSFRFSVRMGVRFAVYSPSEIPRGFANILHELVLSEIKSSIADLEHRFRVFQKCFSFIRITQVQQEKAMLSTCIEEPL